MPNKISGIANTAHWYISIVLFRSTLTIKKLETPEPPLFPQAWKIAAGKILPLFLVSHMSVIPVAMQLTVMQTMPSHGNPQ